MFDGFPTGTLVVTFSIVFPVEDRCKIMQLRVSGTAHREIPTVSKLRTYTKTVKLAELGL